MLHLRLIVPSDRVLTVLELLEGDASVTHLVVLAGAARDPAGDVVLCDVAREGASAVLSALRDLGIPDDGSIAVENIDVVLSAAGEKAERDAPGLGTDAVVWEEIEQRVGDEVELSATYLVFLTVATIIAAIGVLLDQPILIVGAMVVGPDFGPLAALCVGVVLRKRAMAVKAAVALVVGFPVAMLLTLGAVRLLDVAGLVEKSMLLADRPLTDFIWRPDALSWVVGFLAGIAGIVSLTSAKSGALVGVLISVTTVPAAANVSVAVAYGVYDEAWGSTVQLVVNLAAIVVGGVVTLVVQRTFWRQRALRPKRTRAAQLVAARARRAARTKGRS
ncbi:DUF389 domain-containing protein [Cryptosporangium phraense]|uniref:DUF389 domain-containing protein n=1 Tax=Cryptosporangium phraense TaxID=2593070 RepID=A0A545AG35_9ACTN|nr:DUF389 domain-containing protein [Cryptosporangium phraense]TQS40296.1 DUF389 domain-containing protein [Cryptosporangium phraense]